MSQRHKQILDTSDKCTSRLNNIKESVKRMNRQYLVNLIFITVREGFFRFPARKFCGRFYSIVKKLGFRLDPILPFFGSMVAVVLKKNVARR